jgi:hypothetical protein
VTVHRVWRKKFDSLQSHWGFVCLPSELNVLIDLAAQLLCISEVLSSVTLLYIGYAVQGVELSSSSSVGRFKDVASD